MEMRIKCILQKFRVIVTIFFGHTKFRSNLINFFYFLPCDSLGKNSKKELLLLKARK